MNIAQQILQSDDTQYEDVACPEWGCTLTVRSITGTERDKFEESLMKTTKKMKKGKVRTEREVTYDNIRAKLIVLSVCIAKGNPQRMFSDEDAPLLGTKSAAVLDRLFDVAQRLSGLRDEDIDELVKN